MQNLRVVFSFSLFMGSFKWTNMPNSFISILLLLVNAADLASGSWNTIWNTIRSKYD